MQWFFSFFLNLVLTLGWEPITSVYLECHGCDGGGREPICPQPVELQDDLHAAAGCCVWGTVTGRYIPAPAPFSFFSQEKAILIRLPAGHSEKGGGGGCVLCLSGVTHDPIPYTRRTENSDCSLYWVTVYHLRVDPLLSRKVFTG